MALIYITGVAGSGKSTVRQELIRRDFKTVEVDDRLAQFYNNMTGRAVTRPVHAVDRSPKWRQEHTWKISRVLMERLEKEYSEIDIFVCGTASNEIEVSDLFGMVFALTLELKTLKERIDNRSENSFGKSSHEWRTIIEWYNRAPKDFAALGAIPIDSTLPTINVVDNILSLYSQKRSLDT